MRTTIIALAGSLMVVSAYAADEQSGIAEMGRHSRFTHLNGTVSLTQRNAALQVEASIGGLDNKQNYDLLVLTDKCTVSAPFTSSPEDVQPQAAQNKATAQQAARTGTNILTIKAGAGGKAEASTSKISYSNALGKGLLLVQGKDPIECADIQANLPQPAPPPAK